MPDDQSSRLVTLASFGDSIQAGFLRERLASQGIRAFIPDEHTAMLTGVPNAFGGVRLQVFQEDLERAREIMEAQPAGDPDRAIRQENPLGWDQPSPEAAGDPVCPACGSDLVERAGHRPGQILPSLLLLGIPLLFLRRDLACRSCGHRWSPAA